MATYKQKPRIIVEESPWGNFVQSLPDTVLAFMRLRNQMEHSAMEKEKDRTYQLSKLYLENKQGEAKILKDHTLDLIKDASEMGLKTKLDLDKISQTNPIDSTKNSTDILNSMIGFQDNVINYFTDVHDDVTEQIRFAGAGANAAMILDANLDKTITNEEINRFQIENGELSEEMLEPFIQGAKYWLNKPSNAKAITQESNRRNTKKALEALSNPDIFPQLQGNKNLMAANVLFQSNPNSPKVLESMQKVFEDSDVTQEYKDNLKSKDVAIRNIMESIGEAGKNKGISKDHFKGLRIKGTENFKANTASSHESISILANDAASDLAVFFSGKTPDGTSAKHDIDADWIKQVFEDKGGWDDYRFAVDQVLSDARWAEIMSDPIKMKDAFDFKGIKGKEASATADFIKRVQLYNMVNELDGVNVFGNNFIQGLDLGDPVNSAQDSTVGPENNITAPADTSTVPTDSANVPINAGNINTNNIPTEFLTEPQRQQMLATGVSQHTNLNEITASLNSLQQTFVDGSTDAPTAEILGKALDMVSEEAHIKELVDAINYSPAVKRDLFLKSEATGEDTTIEDLLNEWVAEGKPDMGEWLMDNFENIEPEFIK